MSSTGINQNFYLMYYILTLCSELIYTYL